MVDNSTYKLENIDKIKRNMEKIEDKISEYNNLSEDKIIYEKIMQKNMIEYRTDIAILDSELTYWNTGFGEESLRYIRKRNLSRKGNQDDLEILLSENVVFDARDEPLNIIFYEDKNRIESSKDVLYELNILKPGLHDHGNYLDVTKKLRGDVKSIPNGYPELLEELLVSGITGRDIHNSITKTIDKYIKKPIESEEHN